ncbi:MULTISPECIES: DUF2079 domain-containing protein [Aphanizomenonaceae]|uniref:DUF2079 domain-containing protein n=1 Tax=Dolichospermum heterosporum TAC447 TaxID=747523 RepID=A0ABY5LPF5_9CYAN|nr:MULTISPECIES: DUF2079 domain-containing protein [Aphanizomenonaceae]MBE9259871.1 DUF2079 domain-containing protein [Dolichospermum sp. LEGE 00246]MDK2411627.1 DUF2079 domain-containing protein [Aphanizomenon sp. 202]MDK2459111.1 DUF2079 domain-containing protein [Aphanizomenon sp. PH219]UUO13837.1 DUF2079 domain-containing protein [Dolichospermum heterosporum TAC447]
MEKLIPKNNISVIISISALILLAASIIRHELFNSSGDLAFFDQTVYLISQGKLPTSSVLGFHVLADHAAWILYPIALLYKIYPHVYWLFVVQSVALSLGAFPTYLLALQAGLKDNQAIAMVVVYLLYPVLYNSNLCDFHPDTLAVPALLTAVLNARSKKVFWFCINVLVVLGCKAVLSLTVAAMGVWLLLFEKRRLYGFIAIISGLAWFVIANKIIIPFFGSEAALVSRHFYRYSYLGNSFSETLQIILFQPKIIISNILSSINLEYLFFLLAPVIWGLIPKYMTPLIGAIPCLALNILADHPSQKNVILHYSLPAIPFIMLALIASIAADKAWLKQKRVIFLWSLIWFLILGKWGFFISKYLNSVDNWQATKEAISLVKTQDSVLTTDVITPHLTHRQQISFKYKLHELNNFHYILLNTRHPGWGATVEDYNNLTKELKKRSDFNLKYQRDDVYLFVYKKMALPI